MKIELKNYLYIEKNKKLTRNFGLSILSRKLYNFRDKIREYKTI